MPDLTGSSPAGKDTGHPESTTMNKLQEPEIPTWRLACLLLSLAVGLFLSFLDTSIVATALYTIGVEFQSLTTVTWVALAYTLAYLGCCTIFASLADVIGRRNAYVAAYIIFLAFSIGCGFAQSLNQLIALRALQGVGGSGLYSIAMIIFSEISTLKMIKFIGSFAGAVVAISGVLGPVLGGIITHYTTWRWIFWINAPIGIAPLLLFILAWPKPHMMRPVQHLPLKNIDFIGYALLIASSVLVVFSFQQGGIHIAESPNIWKSALFITPLVIGIVCWFALFGWAWLVARLWESSIIAVLPLRLLKRRLYTVSTIVTMLAGYPYFTIIFSLPARFQVVYGRSALGAGVALLPSLGATAIGSMVGGMVSGKRNFTFPVMLIASCFTVIGSAALSTLSNSSESQAKAYGLQVFIGLGFGLTVSSSGLIAGIESEARDNAVAQGIMAQSRVLGGSIGIAASTAILGVQERKHILDPGIATPQQLQSLKDSMNTFSITQIRAVRDTYGDAFTESMRVCAIVAAVCTLVSLGLWERHPQTIEEKLRRVAEKEEARTKADDDVTHLKF